MKLKDHIAYRFLTDEVFWVEILEKHYPNIVDKFEKDEEMPEDAIGLYQILSIDRDRHIPRYVSGTVIEKADYLKIKRKDGILDWTVFDSVPNEKYTYIFPDNALLRIVFYQEMVHILLMHFEFTDKKKGEGQAHWTLLYANRKTGERADYSEQEKGKVAEELAYRLLCFVHLSEIEEFTIEQGRKWGTRKTGKIINTLPFDLLRIDSTWNITSIRTDEFGVRGHFAIRWTGKGRKIPKLVWIDPFKKKGYVRTAKKIKRE